MARKSSPSRIDTIGQKVICCALFNEAATDNITETSIVVRPNVLNVIREIQFIYEFSKILNVCV